MVETIDLGQELRATALREGADLCGIADLTPARDFIVAQGGEYLANFPRAVSVSVALSPAAVAGLGRREDNALAQTYHEYIYGIVNRKLNDVAMHLSGALMREGHRAYLVPASQTVDAANHAGLFSHKLAAHLGGLGFIGRGCLLVTPRFGARVRFATVLTDAPLSADSPGTGACGDCRRCVEICPARAFTGAEFRPEDPRDVRMNAMLCRRYMDHREKTVGRAVCGVCVSVCDGQS